MDLETALEFVDRTLIRQAGKTLRPPEQTVFRGTWEGMTYDRMADSSPYSANYLMRDIAPKLWKLLSTVFQENIGKNNLQVKLNAIYKNNAGGQTVQEIATPTTKIDWGNSSAIPSSFYDKTEILANLQQWLVEEKCSLIKLWGLSGTGKTSTLRKLGEAIHQNYDFVIWRSLANAPSLDSLIADLLKAGLGNLPTDSSRLILEFMAGIQSRPSLIILDNWEGILQPNELNGKYLPGYENYGRFLQQILETFHQGSLIISSLENFEIAATSHRQRNLKLSGLSPIDARSWLQKSDSQLRGNLDRLIEYYQGHPAMLLYAVRVIEDLFNGNIDEFFTQRSLVFGEIALLLDRSFARLSVLEKEILYWLTSAGQPMSWSQIQESFPLSIYPVEMIEALNSLNARCLIETQKIDERSMLVLPPTISELVTNHFLSQIGGDFSLVNRDTSLFEKNIIDLGSKPLEVTQLSAWLEDRFDPAWKPVETLFAAWGRSPVRLRSAFNLRGEGTIKRFKEIKLGAKNSITPILLIAISRELSGYKICVQLQPVATQTTLPANIELNLLDESKNLLATISAKEEDNFIQLPYFRGIKDETFTVGVVWQSASYEEEFVI